MVAQARQHGRLRRVAAGARRWGRRLLTAAPAALLVVVAVLALAPLRGAVLTLGLRLADRALPGELAVGRSAWPRLGLIELEDVVWTGAGADPDTVLRLRRAALAADLPALRHKDVVLDSLAVEAAWLDAPALGALLAGGSPTPADTAAAAGGGWTAAFPREGAWPGLPSIAVGRLVLALDRGRLAPAVTADSVRVVAAGDLRAGHAPALDVRAGRGRLRREGEAPVRAELAALRLDTRWREESRTLGLDTLSVVVTAAGSPDLVARWRGGPPLRVDGRGAIGGDRDAGYGGGLTLRVEGPGAALAGAAWPDSLDRRAFAAVAADLDLAGRASRDSVDVRATVRIAPTGPLRGALLVGSARFAPTAPADGAYRVDSLAVALAGASLQGRGRYAGGEVDARLGVTLRTPIPVLAAYVPAVAGLDGSVRGTVRVSGRPDAPGNATVAVDSLVAVVAGASLRGRAGYAGGEVGAELRLKMATPVPVLAAFVPAVGDLDGTLRGTVRLSGTREAPRVRADLRGGLQEGPVVAPDFHLRLEGDRRGATATLGTGGGLARDGVALADSGRLRLRAVPAAAGGDLAAGGPLDLTVAADLSRAAGAAVLRGEARLDPAAPAAATVRLDSLDVAYPGLRVRGHARWDGTRLDCDLDGEVSKPSPLLESLVPELADAEYRADWRVRVQGPPRDPEVDAEAAAGLVAPFVRVPRLELAARGDRRRFALRLAAGGGLELQGRPLADSLRARVSRDTAAGDSLSLRTAAAVWRGDAHAELAAAAGADAGALTVRLDTLRMKLAKGDLRLQRPATVRLDTAARRVTVTPLTLTGAAGMLEAEGTASPAYTDLRLAADLRLSESALQTIAPSPLWSREGGVDLGAAGEARLELGPETARFAGGMQLTAYPHRDHPTLGAALEFRLAEGDSAGLGADFSLVAADTAFLSGSLLWPGRYDRGVGRWVMPEGSLVEVDVPEQVLPTRMLGMLLPPRYGARGEVTVGVQAAVPADPDLLRGGTADPARGSVSGRLATRRLQVTLPENSRLELRADCRLEGSPADLRLAGEVTVPSAFLQVPEIPRSLLPTEGEPLLWELAPPDSATADTAGAGPQVWGEKATPAPPPPLLPDLDLKISVPGNFRVRGYGLDVVMAGEVTVERGEDARGRPGPALHGEAHAVDGTLKLMNRIFQVRRAEMTFTGSVPPDPRLDIVLETDVRGTVVRLRVDGRATKPDVTLESSPPLDRGDIIAVLLFGQPLNDLDADQRGSAGNENDPAQQLRENLAGLALVFGTGGLQNSVRSALGVDIIEVGAGGESGSTLTAGKYLSPRLLVKYNTSLEKAGTYYLTLEYALTQIFKIVTTYGQGEQASGAELQWERRY